MNPVWIEIAVNVVLGYLILDRIKSLEKLHMQHINNHAEGKYAGMVRSVQG